MFSINESSFIENISPKGSLLVRAAFPYAATIMQINVYIIVNATRVVWKTVSIVVDVDNTILTSVPNPSVTHALLIDVYHS